LLQTRIIDEWIDASLTDDAAKVRVRYGSVGDEQALYADGVTTSEWNTTAHARKNSTTRSSKRHRRGLFSLTAEFNSIARLMHSGKIGDQAGSLGAILSH